MQRDVKWGLVLIDLPTPGLRPTTTTSTIFLKSFQFPTRNLNILTISRNLQNITNNNFWSSLTCQPLDCFQQPPPPILEIPTISHEKWGQIDNLDTLCNWMQPFSNVRCIPDISHRRRLCKQILSGVTVSGFNVKICVFVLLGVFLGNLWVFSNDLGCKILDPRILSV